MGEAVTAKARAFNGTHLTKDDYNNLLHKKDIAGVVAYLKTTERYGDIFDGVNEKAIHRGLVEQTLSKQVFLTYMKFLKFMSAGKNSFCRYFIKEQEVKQILLAIMYINANSNEGYLVEMPGYLIDYVCFDMMKLAYAKSFDQLLEALADTPYYKVLKPFAKDSSDPKNLENCAIALRTRYIEWAIKAIENDYSGDTQKELKDIFLRRAELSNILLCYRRKKYFNESNERIENSLYHFYYRANIKKIENMLSRPDADKQFLLFLKKFYFRDKIAYDPDYIDLAITEYDYVYYKNKLNFTDSGIMALYSLIVLCETERSNLQKIIEGARYNRPPDETVKLLVM